MATATPALGIQQLRTWIERYNYNVEYQGEPTVVSLYECWTRYGGPEEGGYYYECGYPIKGICVFSKKQAIRAAIQLYEEGIKQYETERDHLGWLNFCVTFEQGYPKPYPKERPTYE